MKNEESGMKNFYLNKMFVLAVILRDLRTTIGGGCRLAPDSCMSEAWT